MNWIALNVGEWKQINWTVQFPDYEERMQRMSEWTWIALAEMEGTL